MLSSIPFGRNLTSLVINKKNANNENDQGLYFLPQTITAGVRACTCTLTKSQSGEMRNDIIKRNRGIVLRLRGVIGSLRPATNGYLNAID